MLFSFAQFEVVYLQKSFLVKYLSLRKFLVFVSNKTVLRIPAYDTADTLPGEDLY